MKVKSDLKNVFGKVCEYTTIKDGICYLTKIFGEFFFEIQEKILL
jgi:hypothetical protein